MGNLLLHDTAVADRRNIVGGSPVARRIFVAVVDRAGFEGFDRDGRIAVVVIAHNIEIIPADIDRVTAAPVVGHPRIGDRTPGFEALYSVRPAAERRFQRHGFEIPPLPVMFRKHYELADY